MYGLDGAVVGARQGDGVGGVCLGGDSARQRRAAIPLVHPAGSQRTGNQWPQPNLFLLFLALLPRFIRPAGWPPAAKVLVLSLVHLTSCALIYPAVGAGPAGSCRPDR